MVARVRIYMLQGMSFEDAKGRAEGRSGTPGFVRTATGARVVLPDAPPARPRLFPADVRPSLGGRSPSKYVDRVRHEPPIWRLGRSLVQQKPASGTSLSKKVLVSFQ